MKNPCIVKQLLTMQGFFIFGPPILLCAARGGRY